MSGAWRPGGGHSFSGGGGGGGGGFSSGGGGGGWGSSSSGGGWGSSSSSYSSRGGAPADPAFVFLVIVAVIIYVVVKLALQKQRDQAQTWSSGSFHEPPAPVAAPVAAPRLDSLRADDPELSEVLFDDFVYALYARAQAARHDAAALETLTPWISSDARASLERRARGGYRVTASLVGAMKKVRVRVTTEAAFGAPPSAWVRVAFESNLILEGPAGARATQYVVEEWVLRRATGVQTRPWKGARVFACPNCAAPAEKLAAAACSFCGQPVGDGRFDWVVSQIDVKRAEERAPSLTGTSVEVGTDWPTVFDAEVQPRWAALLADDPALSVEGLGERLALIYARVNQGWNARDAAVFRPFVSEGMAEYLGYWLEAYASQGLHNLNEQAACTNWLIARVVRDKHYDAVTVRLWARGLEYTLAGERVVGGSRSTPRAYSEYWTLIRGAGVRGRPRVDRGCPGCGAELVVGMGGACAHCGAHVTRGEFDWVLSKIEQDDGYGG